MAILKNYEVEFLSPDEKIKDSIVTILTEPAPNPKFKSPAVCEVSLENGEKRIFSFNKTTIKNCQSVYGKESLNWVNKQLVSLGICKMGNMSGTEWKPKQ